MRVYIRLARRTDRESVLKFTERTWEWGDYIPDIWDVWIKEPRSKLFVATFNSVAVGMEHIVMVSDKEAWLEGLRVDPSFRRQGIAMKLTERCIDESQGFGAQVVRFITSSLNTRVHKIAASFGFERVVVIQPMQASALKGNNQSTVVADRKYLSSLIDFIQCSKEYEVGGGLYSIGWRFCALNTEEIKKKLDEGQFRLICDEYDILAVSIVEKRMYGNALAISYAAGDVNSLTQLARDIRKEAGAAELEEVSTRLPDTQEIQIGFSQAGYQKADEHPYWIFEKIMVL